MGNPAVQVVRVEDVCRAVPGWSQVGFDTASGAAGYGTFSALLAGFSISGLLWIAATDRAQLNRRAVVGLFASVVPLAVATLLYAEVGGEKVCGRAVMENPLPSLLLTVGAVALFSSLADLLANDLAENEQRFGRVLKWLVIGFGTGGVFSANLSLLRSFSPKGEALMSVWATQAILLLAALAVSAIWKSTAPRLLMAYVVLGLAAFAYVVMYAIAFFDYPTWAPSWLSWMRVVIWMGFVAVATRLYEKDSPPAAGGDASSPT